MSRWIDADAIKRELRVWATNLGNPKWFGKDEAEIVIDFAPSIDIVRCKECKWYKQSETFCANWNGLWQANDEAFCSYGEREGE